ncbi:rolling circle replication-associated protein [Enterocloster citroniae]|uniref:rolling circle replication-associated protein n=1 Tax=Enterocloster citroniae TaxID=358743 RepID=UPI00349EBF3D
MEPYNVKIITYPDLTKQYRIYQNTIGSDDLSIPVRPRNGGDRNPFDGKVCKDILVDIKDYKNHVDEVSIKRTRKKVYDYAKSNEWQWFVTFTFSPDKVNRYDYDECTKYLSKWFNNLKRSSPALSYLVVPEQHKDGAYHFHGLFSGINERQIVWTGKYVVKRVRGLRSKFVRTKEKIYKIGSYKLGWMTATKVREMEKVTSYITKYITKDMLNGLHGRKRYWCSRNLVLPLEEVFTLDATDRFILSQELDDSSRFKKVSQVCYGDMTQSVNIYEV